MPRPTRKHSAVLRDWVPGSGARVADVGCGRGGIARILAKAGAEVIGLDPQLDALRRAVAAGPVEAGALYYAVAGGEALPLANQSLHAAVYFNALHHVPVDLIDTALDELARTLKPGARAVVVEPIAEGPQFELVKPIEDETEVRAAAWHALHRAAKGDTWTLDHESEYTAAIRHESFEAWRDAVVGVDPARADTVAAMEADLRTRFHASARFAEDAYWLDQPTRLTVLTRI